jgi:stress response protein YsnF
VPPPEFAAVIPTGTQRSDDNLKIRSAERLRAGSINVAVGRARLVTFIVTEEQTLTVSVRRQEVRLVHDLLPAHEQVVSDAEPAEDVYEVVLYAEQVLLTKQVVPVERVRLVKRVRNTGETVTEQVRSEQIDVEIVEPDHVTSNVDEPVAPPSP